MARKASGTLRQDVLSRLTTEPLSVREIARQVDAGDDSVRTILRRLHAEGSIDRVEDDGLKWKVR